MSKLGISLALVLATLAPPAWADAPAEADSVEEPERPPSDAAPARPPHPEPRVIVSVESVRGPHAKKDVERSARLGWGRIVRCYKASGTRLSGEIGLELVVSGSGTVASSR